MTQEHVQQAAAIFKILETDAARKMRSSQVAEILADVIERLKRLDSAERVVEAAGFIRDYAHDVGECAVCSYPLVAGNSLTCDSDCPGYQLRTALAAHDALLRGE